MYHEHHLPCLHCQPQEYIRMVQHLIERCLLFHMSRDDCIKALEKHANIQPVITLAVWRGLLKENKGFFQAYFDAISPAFSSRFPWKEYNNFGRRKQWK
ncbi:uncharacterized protein LOC8281764 [Ricinus communis]|uniref:Uncharacterized protein n=1 Tax=Ricinus communis TaxID=3988 RepID=B9S621_RICCO|nr:uncharacterized protein LOC8281764 [Ricinus communis]EEF40930.1 conserved hypothetical protein [Ricinus communis]|eukprot:XP_002521440.1 uncharacterized protein LOC8281764 [Ricinus communis]